jgi:hypothetical protein
MQLPRGKFRAIKKGVHLGETLDEMTKTRFSGICSFSSGTINGTMVFRNGIVVLAKVQNLYGDPAWDESGSLRDHVVDAIVSDLDNTQMQLALEFNKKAFVQKGAILHAAPQMKREVLFVQQEPVVHTVDPRHEPKEKDFIKTVPVPLPDQVLAAEDGGKPALEGPQNTGESLPRMDQKPVPEPEQTTAEKELDNFDAMDIDEVTLKLRKDAKIMLKQLQLDHLIEK